MYVSPQGLLVAGDDPQLNPNDKGLIAAVLPHAAGVQIVAKGKHQRWGFATGPIDIKTTAGAGMQVPGIGSNYLTNDTVRLYSTANATDTVWERPVKQVSVLVVFIKYGNASGATPLFENGSPNTAPYEAWGLVDVSGVLQFGYSAGGTYRFLQAEAGSVGLGQVIVALATYNGTTARIYKNGALRNSGSQTGDLTYPNAADRGPGLTSFWDYPFNNRALNGRIFLAALWDVGLSEGYATEITKSPQAAFEAVLGRSRLWLPMPTSAGGAAAVLEAASAAQASVTGALSTSLNLAATPAAQATATGALSTAIPLAATSAAQAAATGALSTAVRLAAVPSAQATATAALSTAIPFAAAPTAQATATAALDVPKPLAATPAAEAAATGALSTAIQLVAAPEALATAAADLSTTPAGLAASPTAQAAATGDLTTAVVLAASSAAESVATGVLTTSVQLAAAPAAVATATADLTAAGTGLAAAATTQASATADLSTAVQLAAAPTAQATATGAIGASEVVLAAAPAAQATATAALSTSIPLAAAPTAACTASASLSTSIQLATAVGAESSASLSLIVATALFANAVVEAAAQASLLTFNLPDTAGTADVMVVPPEGSAMVVAADPTTMNVEP